MERQASGGSPAFHNLPAIEELLAAGAGVPSLGVHEVAGMLADARAVVIDVSAVSRYRCAHLPSARLLDPCDFGRGDLPPPGPRSLVFYCSDETCGSARIAAARAAAMGVPGTAVMAAGLAGWVAAGLPVEREPGAG